MIDGLPRVLPGPDGKPAAAPDGELLRAFARNLATGAQPWTPETATFLAGQFDQMAPGWDTAHATRRDEPVRDALARGGPFPAGPCLEAGSGTGWYTPLLATAFPAVASLDFSEEMLRQAAGRSAHRVRADAARLPFPDGSLAAVVAIDMLLFPAETARVLRADGVLLWINQLGADGPLYLPAADVAASLPGRWTGLEAEAGWGSWAVLRRGPEPA